MTNYNLFLSFINSIIMIVGIGAVGSVIIKLTLKFSSNNIGNILFGTEILLGVILISISISWATLFLKGLVIYQLFATILFFIGIITIIRIPIKFKISNLYFLNSERILKLDLAIAIVIPILYIISNSGNITNADSIDYHVGYALNYLKSDFDSHPDWYNGRMASIGEKLNAIGLSVYSQQFGPLLQIAGYISIGLILIGICNEKLNSNYLIPLTLFSAPVFLFLGTSAKPQILPTALSCLSFYLIHSLDKYDKLLNKDRYLIIAISILLSSIAFTHKFSFIISYAFILVYMLWIFRNSRFDFLYISILFVSISFVVIFPAFYDKFIRYGSTIFEYFLNPVSSSEDSLKYFIETARQYRESKFLFPIYLIIPDSFSKISTVLGIGVFLAAIPLFKNNVIKNSLRIIIAINIIFLALVSMPSSRFFLEIYIWLLIVLSLSNSIYKLINSMVVRNLIYLQSVLIIICLSPISFYAFVNLIGINGDYFRENFVNGYNLYKWYSGRLSNNEPILLDHRSRSLSDRNIVSLEVYEFSKNNSDNYKILKSQLLKYNIQNVVTVNNSRSFNEILKCSNSLKFGPEKLKISTRNPFNSDYEYGYIFSIEPNSFVECLKNQ